MEIKHEKEMKFIYSSIFPQMFCETTAAITVQVPCQTFAQHFIAHSG